MATAIVTAPTSDPSGRDPATIANPVENAPKALVWIYRVDSWRPGLMLNSSALVATVRYRRTHGRGALVDTALPPDLVLRDEFDPGLNPPRAAASTTAREHLRDTRLPQPAPPHPGLPSPIHAIRRTRPAPGQNRTARHGSPRRLFHAVGR